jgi:hypothetical protein
MKDPRNLKLSLISKIKAFRQELTLLRSNTESDHKRDSIERYRLTIHSELGLGLSSKASRYFQV